MQEFSQHTNIFGALTSTFPQEKVPDVINTILHDVNLIQTTIYFKFYLFEALKKADMGDLYLDQLGPWYDMIGEGLTTLKREILMTDRIAMRGEVAHYTILCLL